MTPVARASRPGRGASIPAAQRGLTLIELILSMVIVSIALAGVTLVMNQTSGHSADAMIEHQAVAIAESYLEEAMLKSYLDPDTGTVCPAKEASRDLYDNVCDYNGLDDSGAIDQSGTAITPELDAYRVRVNIDTAAALNGLSGSGQVLKVDVRVTHSDLVDLMLTAYRTNY